MLKGQAGMPDLRFFSITAVERIPVHKWIADSQEIASPCMELAMTDKILVKSSVRSEMMY